MSSQKTAGSAEAVEPKKEKLSRFKSALKSVKRGIRNRVMPFVITSLISVSPALAQNYEYYETNNPKMIERMENNYPGVKNQEALMHVLCISHAGDSGKIGVSLKNIMSGIGKTIENNHTNAIFCIALNSVLKEVIEGDSTYYLGAYETATMIRDRPDNPTKMLTIIPFGKDGIEVKVEYNTGEEKTFRITPKSGEKDVDELNAAVNRFFGTQLPNLWTINFQLDSAYNIK